MTATSPLGFIGLGNIGSGLCANLVSKGHEVTALDTDGGRLAAMVDKGARSAASPAEVASRSEVTFASLPTPPATRSVAAAWLEGARGSDKVFVDLSTNSPAVVRALGDELERGGAHLVEAPVTGGAVGARKGSLVFIVGGDPEVVARVAPLLDEMGRATLPMGPLGSANVAKLVNSLVAFTDMWVSLEALALGAKSGVDLRALVSLVRESAAASPYLARRVEDMNRRGRPAEFSLELAAKDAGLIVELAREAEVPAPVASGVHQALVFALAQGLADRDIAELVEVMESLAGTSLHLPPPEG